MQIRFLLFINTMTLFPHQVFMMKLKCIVYFIDLIMRIDGEMRSDGVGDVMAATAVYCMPPSALTGRMWEPPAEYGSICRGADDVLVVGADLDAADVATVPDAYMGHHAVSVLPHLHQLLITTCTNTEEQRPAVCTITH